MYYTGDAGEPQCAPDTEYEPVISYRMIDDTAVRKKRKDAFDVHMKTPFEELRESKAEAEQSLLSAEQLEAVKKRRASWIKYAAKRR